MRATLTLSIKVKKMLEAIKGNMTWDNFILKTIMEVQEEYREETIVSLHLYLKNLRPKWETVKRCVQLNSIQI